jgi:hypothetical protein
MLLDLVPRLNSHENEDLTISITKIILSCLAARCRNSFFQGAQERELTRELEECATSVLGFELFSGAPADMGQHGGPKRQFYRCNRRTRCFAYIGISGMRSVQGMCSEANRLDDGGRAYDFLQERNLPTTLSLGPHRWTCSCRSTCARRAASISNSARVATCSATTPSRLIPRIWRSGARTRFDGLGTKRHALVGLSRTGLYPLSAQHRDTFHWRSTTSGRAGATASNWPGRTGRSRRADLDDLFASWE